MFQWVSVFGERVKRKATSGLPRIRRRQFDQRGSMSTQVVVFSVMLFGASGLVLDFGRFYSEHTHMQSFTDQAALAAASELDYEPDAIERAVAAVFGADLNAPLRKGANWSVGEGNQFNIEYLIFLDELSPDTGRQTAMGDLGDAENIYVAFANGEDAGDEVAAATSARYVVAVAEERSVRNSLVQLMNVVEDNKAPTGNVVRTIAAAKRKALHCGTRSNLVMCNPFEGTTTGLNQFITDPANEGVQLHLIADNTMSDIQRLAMMRQPFSTGAISGVCDDPATLPGFSAGMSDAELARAITICHLAAAQPANYCVQDQIEIVAADPAVIQTAFGTVFDLWDEPISDVLAPTVPDTTKALFQPDINITKGRVRETDAIIATNAGNGIPSSSRRNYTRTESDYYGSLSACIRDQNAGACQPGLTHVSQPYSYGELLGYYTNYWADHFIFVAGGAIPGFDVSKMYAAYQMERTEWTHSEFKDFEAPFGEADSLAHPINDSDGVSKREDASLFPNTGPDAFMPHQDNFANYTKGSIALSTDERRRFGVTFVKCDAASSTFDADLGTDVLTADVVGFADVLLIAPPIPGCPGAKLFADGTETEAELKSWEDCRNEDLDFSQVFLEFIEQSVSNDSAYSVLVR